MRDFNLLIGGQLVPGAATIPVINPATENVLADAPRASLAQLNDAVAAARQVLRPGQHALCESAANCWSRWRTHLLRVRTTSLGSSPRNKGSHCRTPQARYRIRSM